jgi:hypothetical protein
MDRASDDNSTASNRGVRGAWIGAASSVLAAIIGAGALLISTGGDPGSTPPSQTSLTPPLTASTATTPESKRGLPTGVFSATVSQKPLKLPPYSARIELLSTALHEGQVGALISYPELACGGKLYYLKHRKSAYFFREIVTPGSQCGSGGGTVSLKPQSSGLYFKWTHNHNTVFGLLFRE